MTLRDQSNSEKPRKVPLEIKLSVRDAFGREKTYTYMWEALESLEHGSGGSSGITVSTGLTDLDAAGVRAEATVRVGI